MSYLNAEPASAGANVDHPVMISPPRFKHHVIQSPHTDHQQRDRRRQDQQANRHADGLVEHESEQAFHETHCTAQRNSQRLATAHDSDAGPSHWGDFDEPRPSGSVSPVRKNAP